MSEKQTIDDASHSDWETENKRQAESQSAGATPDQVQTTGVAAVAAGLGGSDATPRTDSMCFDAKQIGFDGTLECVLAADARIIERALRAALDTLEEDAIAQRAFWGADDKHGIAVEAERIYEKAKAALSPNDASQQRAD